MMSEKEKEDLGKFTDIVRTSRNRGEHFYKEIQRIMKEHVEIKKEEIKSLFLKRYTSYFDLPKELRERAISVDVNKRAVTISIDDLNSYFRKKQ